MFRLKGKTAVVTGGTGALGRAMCKTLAEAGATTVILARNKTNSDALAHELREQGHTAVGYACDVLDRVALEKIAQEIQNQFERADILINGAGGNHADATTLPGQRTFFDLSEDTLRWVFDLNLMGTVLPSQIFGKLMAKHMSGNIINISSMASTQPLTRVVAYAAAKAAVNNFTQWLAVHMATEYGEHIRVNAIAPGFFLGEQNRFLLKNDDETLTARGQQIIDHTPMRRFGDPDDLNGTLLWLASEASRFVTGIVVPVDGGFSAYSGV